MLSGAYIDLHADASVSAGPPQARQHSLTINTICDQTLRESKTVMMMTTVFIHTDGQPAERSGVR